MSHLDLQTIVDICNTLETTDRTLLRELHKEIWEAICGLFDDARIIREDLLPIGNALKDHFDAVLSVGEERDTRIEKTRLELLRLLQLRVRNPHID